MSLVGRIRLRHSNSPTHGVSGDTDGRDVQPAVTSRRRIVSTTHDCRAVICAQVYSYTLNQDR